MKNPGSRRHSFRFFRLAAAALFALLCAAAPACRQLPEKTAPAAPPAEPEMTAGEKALHLESFEYVWRTIQEKHWDPEMGGMDWKGIHDELRPKVEAASSRTQARAVLQTMLARLGLSHFAIFPGELYEEIDRKAVEEPGQAGETAKGEIRENGREEGSCGLDVRLLEGKAVVTRLEQSAAEQGIQLGWQILSINGKELAPAIDRIEEAFADSTLFDNMARGVVLSRLHGKVGEGVEISFLDENDRIVEKTLLLSRPQGVKYKLGHLPEDHVWIKYHELEDEVGYIAFNYFFDPINLMKTFQEAVKTFEESQGIIIDLRGNPGGILGMAMGMAGWFMEGQGQWLGTMHTRDTSLKFTVNPRVGAFKGPVAILVDGCSGSCSEAFAGGMKDLGRARIFGTRTAGAILPSVIERLPNGDGFQYAYADYISQKGERLEGVGVTPDEEVKLSREALLQNRDTVLEAARRWILAP